MGKLMKPILLAASVVAVIMLAGCPVPGPGPGTGPGSQTPVDTTGSLSFAVDLSPAFSQGLSPDAVTVKVVSESKTSEGSLTVDAAAKSASGTLASLPEGSYDATVTVKSGTTVLGVGTGKVDVAARTTTTITVTIVIPAAPTEPQVGVDVH